jgi:GMP synthase (glutamine-hydrolysing)
MGVSGMTEVIAVRHVHFEDLGSFEDVLRERNMKITYLEAGRDRLVEPVEQRAPHLLVVLGGPVGVYESDDYPFLDEEMALIRARLSRRQPLLGICLGAQLIAAALGAKVYPAGVKEIGWRAVELSAAGIAAPLADLTTPVLHWHGDTFDLPAGAVHLASTPDCRNQAFAVGRQVLGVQFHAEVVGRAIESWLIGHACEIAGAPGVTVRGIRADTRRYASRLEDQGRKFFSRWLDGTSA